MAAVPGRAKSWGLAMHAPKGGLRVAPVPPKTADLTRPGMAARAMAGRDEGTGVLIEQRNRCGNASCLAVRITPRIQSTTQWGGRLNTPHTQKFGHSRLRRGGRSC